MRTELQTYAMEHLASSAIRKVIRRLAQSGLRYAPAMMLLVVLQLLGSPALAADLSEFTEPIETVLSVISNVIGPALGIAGLIGAGVAFFFGQTGAPFKIALCVVVGGVLISQAESIWSNLFGGVGVGG